MEHHDLVEMELETDVDMDEPQNPFIGIRNALLLSILLWILFYLVFYPFR
ncbi:hypothetical protein [Thermoactinomyces sp. DSM 45892]|nr:hypothetical protein [Thermoactinomyces sp. DSM 45892]SDZ21517.1 hypothetical protein SAMN05444416_11666 [Thermoactinomyces sp. DSM 45892]